MPNLAYGSTLKYNGATWRRRGSYLYIYRCQCTDVYIEGGPPFDVISERYILLSFISVHNQQAGSKPGPTSRATAGSSSTGY